MNVKYIQSYKKTLLGVCTLMLLAGCNTLHTHSDYDPHVNFYNYKSFAWAGEERLIHSQDVGDRLISALDLRRIKQSIEKELADKGYNQLIDRSDADFLVSFTVGARDKMVVDRYPVSFRNRWIGHWPYVWEQVDVHTYTEGMLAIDIYDSGTERPAWHGVARKRISISDIDNSGPEIQIAVRAVLSKFPPR